MGNNRAKILFVPTNNRLISPAKFDFKCNKYCFTSFDTGKKRYSKKDDLQYKYLFKK